MITEEQYLAAVDVVQQFEKENHLAPYKVAIKHLERRGTKPFSQDSVTPYVVVHGGFAVLTTASGEIIGKQDFIRVTDPCDGPSYAIIKCAIRYGVVNE